MVEVVSYLFVSFCGSGGIVFAVTVTLFFVTQTLTSLLEVWDLFIVIAIHSL